MRRFGPWFLHLLFLAVMQTVVGGSLEVFRIKPDFFLISVVLVAMERGARAGALWGAVLGLVQDVLSGGVVGLSFLTKPAVGYAVGMLRSKLDFGNPNTQTLTTLGVGLAEGFVLSVLLSAYQPSKAVAWTMYRIILPQSIYNSLLVPLILPATRLFRGWLEGLGNRPSRMAE